MSLRKKINDSPLVGSLASVALLALAGVVVWLSFFSGSGIEPMTGMYFYDADADAVVVLPMDSVSPYKMGNGNTAYEALVYACEECPEMPTVDDVYFVRAMRSDDLQKANAIAELEGRRAFMQEVASWENASVADVKNNVWVSERTQGDKFITPLADLCDNIRDLKKCWQTQGSD